MGEVKPLGARCEHLQTKALSFTIFYRIQGFSLFIENVHRACEHRARARHHHAPLTDARRFNENIEMVFRNIATFLPHASILKELKRGKASQTPIYILGVALGSPAVGARPLEGRPAMLEKVTVTASKAVPPGRQWFAPEPPHPAWHQGLCGSLQPSLTARLRQ